MVAVVRPLPTVVAGRYLASSRFVAIAIGAVPSVGSDQVIVTEVRLSLSRTRLGAPSASAVTNRVEVGSGGAASLASGSRAPLAPADALAEGLPVLPEPASYRTR